MSRLWLEASCFLLKEELHVERSKMAQKYFEKVGGSKQPPTRQFFLFFIIL